MRLSHANLRGRTVIGADGQAVGEVSALLVDAGAWGIQSLQVKLRKGIANRLGTVGAVCYAGTIDIPVRLIQSVGDAVILCVPVDGLWKVRPAEIEPAAMR